MELTIDLTGNEGTAFRGLACASEIMPELLIAQNAEEWQEREQALATTYRIDAQLHNGLHLTEPLEEKVNSFFDRPFSVIGGIDASLPLPFHWIKD